MPPPYHEKLSNMHQHTASKDDRDGYWLIHIHAILL